MNHQIFQANSLEISEIELRIVNWLEENGVFQGIPEEKQYKFYERKRRNAHEIKEHSSSSALDSPLLQRRRNSLPNKNKETDNILKLSKFLTHKCLEVPCSLSRLKNK